MTDPLKLVWGAATFMPDVRQMLLFSDEAAAVRFRPRCTTWSGTALTHLGIKIRVVSLTDEQRQAVRRAKERQFR